MTREAEGGSPQASIFEGIRVIDFTHIFAGPYCCKLMADMGAEVLKIEPPVTGERGRSQPYIKNGVSGSYMWRNAGKKGLSLDMKRPKAVEVFKDLVKVSDVVVQNRKVGVVDRLGIGYNDLKEINPRIIMCSISGYGQTGPLASQPGADLNIQAMSGAMSVTGYEDGPPLPYWVHWTDFATGTHAAAAVVAALFHRGRTGAGQHIDVAMLDCAFGFHSYAAQEYLLSDGTVSHPRTGHLHPYLAPAGVFKCRDGYIFLYATTNPAWQQFAELMGYPELVTDPRFDTSPHRDENKDEVNRIVSEWIKDFDVADAKMILDNNGVQCTPILDIKQAVNHPHYAAREMLVEFDHPLVGKFKVVNSPYKFSDTKVGVRGRAPLLGEHNEEVLTNLLGYSKERIAQLWEEKVLYAEPAVFSAARS